MLSFTVFSYLNVRDTIKDSYRLQDSFVKRVSEINDYYDTHKVYPKDEDIFVLSEKESNKEKLNNFIPKNTDKYVLIFQRGHYDVWYEYYAYPSGITSLSFNIKDYISFYYWTLPLLIFTLLSFLGWYIFSKKEKDNYLQK